MIQYRLRLVQPYRRILDLIPLQYLQQFLFIIIQIQFRLAEFLPFLPLDLIVLPQIYQFARTRNAVLQIQVVQQIRVIDISDLHLVLQENNLIDAVLYTMEFFSGIHMLDIDHRDRHRRRTGCHKISRPRIHIQKELQQQKKQDAQPKRRHTDDRHASCIGDQTHHLALPVQIGMLLTLQPAQILFDQILILLRLRQLSVPFFHLVKHPLDLLILLIADPMRPLHEISLTVLQKRHPLRALFKLLTLLRRKRFDLLHIFKVGSYHVILESQILQFSRGIRHSFQTVSDIIGPLFFIGIIHLMYDFLFFPLLVI